MSGFDVDVGTDVGEGVTVVNGVSVDAIGESVGVAMGDAVVGLGL